MRMTFEEFKQELLENRDAYLPVELKNAELSIEHVEKLNRSYDALTIRMPGTNYAASVELDGFYNWHRDFPDASALKDFAEVLGSMDLESGKELADATDFLSDYSKVKDNLFVRVSNAGRSKPLLQNSPYTTLGDIAFTVHVGLNWQEESAPVYTTVVSDQMLESWGISKEALFKDAVDNSARRLPVVCRPLADFMMGMMGAETIERGEPDNGLYVLTNGPGQYGAATVMYPGILDEMHKELGNFYMLPSSVHEFLLLPENFGFPVEQLEMMVRDVNRTVLDEGDFLSDSVYHYDGEEKLMEPVRDYLARRELSENKDLTARIMNPDQKVQPDLPGKNPAVGLSM